MSKTVFNQNDIKITKQPMYFGEDGGFQPYATYKYPHFDKIAWEEKWNFATKFKDPRLQFFAARSG